MGTQAKTGERASKVKWEPAKPLRRPDFIQSSEFGHRKHFYPTYEQDPVDMFYLIGMEYQRIWARERTAWEEQYYPIPTERKVLKIRAVKKPKTAAKKAQPAPFKMKKFQNIPARTDHQRPPKIAQAEQRGDALKPCTCDPDKLKQGDQNAVSKALTPKLTAREKDDETQTDTENEKKLESASCHSDLQKPHDHSSDCKSHKSHNSKDECSHTHMKGEEAKDSVCCCDMQNEDAQEPVGN
ncbi:uncharacterized protein LOC126266693 isoform X2 [Schistocerca gregaria]|uniref:uncharacterized protein LOC126266693 isoform X2 n=1 Tax=Schistocerca gregaria TaxID=7010 RepID=UPI00211DA7CA|nr:uncharacterized protein LOC126266693 isoform X2 [Schistocerca gregaria]